MLTHTQKIKIIYERIQKKIYYMIPEKWEKLYLYCSIANSESKKGELYFYYIPKGVFKKVPVNVYEIPTKFNIDESEYIELVGTLYEEFKELREEFKSRELFKMWSNLTVVMDNYNFNIEYSYEELENTSIENEQRHIMWRNTHLGEYFRCVTKKEKEILKRYVISPNSLAPKELYSEKIYIGYVKNIVEFDTYNEVSDELDEITSGRILSPIEINKKILNLRKNKQVIIKNKKLQKNKNNM